MEDFERPYKQVSRVKALLLFFLRPKAFIELAVEHDIAWQLSESQDIRASYLRGQYKPNLEEYQANAEHRSKGLRRSLFHAAFVVVASGVLGLLIGLLLQQRTGVLAALPSNLLQAIAVAIILWATLWQLTRGLQSFGGSSLPERVHSWIFSSLYTVGTFILFVVYGWQA
ncbi:MAG: hypothetical protein KF892_23485 [Rhizobacter sp.]|nr:hypothetical protein [Rhizobacter sp.]